MGFKWIGTQITQIIDRASPAGLSYYTTQFCHYFPRGTSIKERTNNSVAFPQDAPKIKGKQRLYSFPRDFHQCIVLFPRDSIEMPCNIHDSHETIQLRYFPGRQVTVKTYHLPSHCRQASGCNPLDHIILRHLFTVKMYSLMEEQFITAYMSCETPVLRRTIPCESHGKVIF